MSDRLPILVLLLMACASTVQAQLPPGAYPFKIRVVSLESAAGSWQLYRNGQPEPVGNFIGFYPDDPTINGFRTGIEPGAVSLRFRVASQVLVWINGNWIPFALTGLPRGLAIDWMMASVDGYDPDSFHPTFTVYPYGQPGFVNGMYPEGTTLADVVSSVIGMDATKPDWGFPYQDNYVAVWGASINGYFTVRAATANVVLLPADRFPPNTCLQNVDTCVQPSLNTQEDPFATASKCTSHKTLKTITEQFGCLDPFTGTLKSCNLQISALARNGSGGHLHIEAGRPAGQFSPAFGTTTVTAGFTTVYTAPEVSGIVDVTVSGTLLDGTPVAARTFTIGVEVPGLFAIPASGPGYTTTASTGHDHSNIFANPSFGTNLQRVPVEFAQSLSLQGVPAEKVATLIYTSLSLPFGGTFDVDTNHTGAPTNPWHPPHCGHRDGLAADLDVQSRNLPASQRLALRASILWNHIGFPVRFESPSVPAVNHWHLAPQ